MNIPTRFGSNCPSGSREEDEKQTKPFYTPLDLLFLLEQLEPNLVGIFIGWSSRKFFF
jgi:hypothetical protein